MRNYSNILVIRGEGRNIGKTLLACNIIAKFGRTHNIAGLKISYHQHTNTEKARLIFAEGASHIFEETDPRSQKDTGRMLAAGARHAYLIQTNDKELYKAVDYLCGLLGEDTLIVCESGKIMAASKPGISLFVRQLNCKVCALEDKDPASRADRVVTYTSNGFDLDLNSITPKDHTWILNES